MRKTTLLLFICCLGLIPAIGCTGTTAAKSSSTGSGGTGAGANSGMEASPVSVAFGNIAVGSTGVQSVALTNMTSSSVNLSQPVSSTSAFTTGGPKFPMSLPAGQTVSLNVTFAPTAAGLASGTITVGGDSAAATATIPVTGSGTSSSSTQQTSSAATGTPICGISNDTSNHVPTDWATFVPPAKGQSYVDPTFGCTVTRITDSSNEDWEQYCGTAGCFLPIGHGYSTVSPFNADDTYLMLGDGVGQHFISDLQGNIVVPISNMPDCGNSVACNATNGSNDTWFYWDTTNPAVFYYTFSNSMMKGTISGSSVALNVVHQFTEYSAINFMDKTDLSEDGQHVIIVAGDNTGTSPLNIFNYNFIADTKGPVYTTGCTAAVGGPNNACVHAVSQTPDNNVIIGFAQDGTGTEQGDRLWSGMYPLAHIQDGSNHMDIGYDMNGSSVFVEMGNPDTLSTDVNPCPSGWGLDVRQIYDMGSAVCLLDNQPSWHLGYRGNANQPWVGISYFDDRSRSPEWFDNVSNYVAPSSTSWQLYEDEIMVVRIDANNNPNYAYRLARAYSRSDEDFFAMPRVAISRDGKYLAFGSNMAYAHTGCPANYQSPTGCTDVYLIKIH